MFDAQQVVQVPVEFKERNHVNVPLPAICDDPPNLLLREAAFGIQQRVAVQLNAGFSVEVVLIHFPAGEKVELPLHFVLGKQRAVAHVDHGSTVWERRPVVDFDLGKHRAAGVKELPQGFDTIELSLRGFLRRQD